MFGVLELCKQEVVLGPHNLILDVPIIAHPEKCDHEGRCLVACPQNVFLSLWPQNSDDLRNKAHELKNKSKELA